MKKIVLAQDLNTILRKRNSFLDRADMRVFTATTTDEVLEIHSKVHVDLAIISLDMPGMSSKQLCSQLKEDAEHGAVPVIVVCAHSERAKERGSHCGANVVITRPIKPAQLLTKAKKLLGLSWRETYRVLLNIAVEGSISNNRFVCNSLDISLDGMLIETDQVFKVSDRISCSFFLPDMSQVHTTGEIVRTIIPAPGAKGNWYGVHFLDVSPDAERILETFIDANASKALAEHGDKPA
jgi:two-component system OmpR family response regulator